MTQIRFQMTEIEENLHDQAADLENSDVAIQVSSQKKKSHSATIVIIVTQCRNSHYSYTKTVKSSANNSFLV